MPLVCSASDKGGPNYTGVGFRGAQALILGVPLGFVCIVGDFKTPNVPQGGKAHGQSRYLQTGVRHPSSESLSDTEFLALPDVERRPARETHLNPHLEGARIPVPWT